MATDETNDQMIEYQAYIDHRNALTSSEQQQAMLFDRAAITLSSGALALSITFIKSMVRTAPHAVYLLHIAWAALIIALMCTLSSFRLSVHAHQRERTLLDQKYQGSSSETTNAWNWLVEITNTLSLLLIVAGVSCLSLFVACNAWSSQMNASSLTTIDRMVSASDLGKGVRPAPAPVSPPKPGTGVRPAPPPPPPPKQK